MTLQQVECYGTSSQPRFAASATSDELIADNTGEIPFSVLAEFKVIGMVARHLCGHAYGAPSPIDIGSASHGFSRVSPRSIRFVFINEFEPSLGGQATSTVEEIGRHHSEQRSMILFIDGQCELTPETSPRSFSRRNASRSLREGRQSDEQH